MLKKYDNYDKSRKQKILENSPVERYLYLILFYFCGLFY